MTSPIPLEPVEGAVEETAPSPAPSPSPATTVPGIGDFAALAARVRKIEQFLDKYEPLFEELQHMLADLRALI